MNEIARISALEHLVLAMLKEHALRLGHPINGPFGTAADSILGSNGPGGDPRKPPQARRWII
jgi:hypothetical protein